MLQLQYGGHHRIDDYPRSGELPQNELQIYTWKDASVRELTELVQSAQPAARRTGARLEFALVYPDKRGRNVMRPVSIIPFAYACQEKDNCLLSCVLLSAMYSYFGLTCNSMVFQQ